MASTAEKRTLALRAGADTALDYENLKDRIREATGHRGRRGRRPVGGTAAESALPALATAGRFCVVGFASGEIRGCR